MTSFPSGATRAPDFQNDAAPAAARRSADAPRGAAGRASRLAGAFFFSWEKGRKRPDQRVR
jgi:hypothetical protein